MAAAKKAPGRKTPEKSAPIKKSAAKNAPAKKMPPTDHRTNRARGEDTGPNRTK